MTNVVYKIVGKPEVREDAELGNVVTFISFTASKGKEQVQYSVSLEAPDPDNFYPYEEGDDELLIELVKAKLGTGFTMSEQEIEAELDAKSTVALGLANPA